MHIFTYIFREPFAVRNGIFFCGLTSMYTRINELVPISFVAASISSILCNLIIMPLDLSSVMRQSLHYGNRNARQCIQTVYQQKGIRGLFAGYPSRCIAVAIEIFLFNYFKKFYENVLEKQCVRSD